MAVNLDARVWMPYRELSDIVENAVIQCQQGALHDLNVALRRHKPDFISLLKKPAKNATHRELVRKSTLEGLSVQGEQRKQTFSAQFVAEALILSDLFDLNELAAVELLMAGELQLPNYPGLTRGLVAVLLFYDGQRSLVTALRALAQAREGRTWTVGVSPEMQGLINDFVQQLMEEGIVGTILDLIKSMDLVKEIEKLQNERALGPPKHRKQVTDLFTEVKQTLGDIIFCLACQWPLGQRDTLQLLAYLRADNSLNADETLDSVTLSLLLALWYCFDVSLLQKEDAQEVLSQLPALSEASYVSDIHSELTSTHTPWATPGLQAAAQFAWAVMLRQISQFNLGNGGGSSDCCEDDERLIDMALEGHLFSFLNLSVVAWPNFHSEEFYLRRLHGLVTDFIYQMPLKTKELRNRGDEMSRIILVHQAGGMEPPVQRGDLNNFMMLIGALYSKDPLKLQLSLEYWCPSESPGAPQGMGDTLYRPDPKQVALFKFVRVAGDLLPAPLFLPYIQMLTGLSSGPQSAHHCFSLLRNNGGQANPVSWDHIWGSLHQYYSSLRQEATSTPTPGGRELLYSRASPRSMTPQELEAVCSVLRLARRIAELNETCRSAFCENQQWSVVMVLFGLLACSVSVQLKGELLRTLAAIAQTPVFAATIWQTLEASQILSTTSPSAGTEQPCRGIQVELEEVESRNEEYPLTSGFLDLLATLTQYPVPLGLGAGTREPGFAPYLSFILESVLFKFNTRAYKVTEEKWQVVSGCLQVLLHLLSDYELQTEDLLAGDDLAIRAGSKQPGFTVLCLLLTDSKLFKTIQMILEESIAMFDQFAPFPGHSSLEKTSLLCLELLVEASERQAILERRVRETASPLLVSSLERLLLAINPRTRKADYLINITKFVVFNSHLPQHTLAAVKVLCHVCREAPSQADIVNLFTADKAVSADLLYGFVECLDSSTVETRQERASALLAPQDDVEEESSLTKGPVQNAICEHIIELLLVSLDQVASPNLAHWLMGFQLQKPVAKTTLQDPGVLDSPKTCLHSVLSMLEAGLGTREGPTSLQDRPRLAELGLRLVYSLCAHQDTAAPTLRYLRTTHDFLYKQLQHLPLDGAKYGHDVSDHQAWLMKTAAIELRMTSVNRQRSHTQRLVRLLLGDEEQELFANQLGDEGEVSVLERDSSMSLLQSQPSLMSGKQMRHRLLAVLDTMTFDQSAPQPMGFTFFDKAQIEALVRSLEHRTREGTAYCDVRALRQVLLTELANQQGPMVAGQRPHIMQEIQLILETVVEHNNLRQLAHRRRHAFEAWRQVVEVTLTSVPHDLISGEKRQTVLFDLLQELLIKVNSEEVSVEATSLVSDVLLTLMANLRHSLMAPATPSPSTTSLAAGDTTGPSPYWGIKGSSSRTMFATSLQVVLRGLIDCILKSSGGVQKIRVNLYGALLYCLHIAQPNSPDRDVEVVPDGTWPRKPGLEGLLLSQEEDCELSRRAQENMDTVSSFGHSLMEALCRDACDGHHVGRMLSLSVLDTLLSMDHQGAWLEFLSGRGYLQHLVDAMASQDDAQLVDLLSPQPTNLRALYIFQSKMSLLTRIAQTPEGARTLLHGGALEKLAACTTLSLRPEDDGYSSKLEDDEEDDEDLLPGPMARYQMLLFAVLRFCLALMTSLGGDNREAATQVMLLVVSHSEVFASILRSRPPKLSVAYLRELSLATCVVGRANCHSELGADLMEQDTASMEFKAHRMRLQDQMLALLPHFSTPETTEKLLELRLSSPSPSQRQQATHRATVMGLYQEVAANLTAYCRSLIANIGSSSLNQQLLFGPSLEELTVREGTDMSMTLGVGRRLGLGVVLLLLQQSSRQFSVLWERHHQDRQKLACLAQLTLEDLKQLCSDSAMEKLSSQQRQEVARTRLYQLLAQTSRQLHHYVYIVENCLYIIWRHLEFFLVHCVPADASTMTAPTLIRHHTGLRRLTGASESSLNSSLVGSPVGGPGVSQVALGVTRQDIGHMRAVAPSVLNEAFFKRVQHVDQCLGKQRTHYSFSEAIVRRIKRVLKLHTGL